MVTAVLAASFAFIFYLFVSLGILWIFRPKRALLAMGLAFLICLPLCLFLTPSLSAFGFDSGVSPIFQFLTTGFFVFFFLCFGYSQVHGLFRLSLTVDLLVHLYHAPNSTLSLEEIVSLFGFEETLKAKLERAVRSGIFEKSEISGKPALKVTRKLRLFVAPLIFFRKLLRIN